MIFKQHPLSDVVGALNKMADRMEEVMRGHGRLEAEKKHFFATLVIKHSGPNTSHAQAVTRAEASKEWLEFSLQLEEAARKLRFHEMKNRVLEKEYQSQYITLKLDQGLIGKGAE